MQGWRDLLNSWRQHTVLVTIVLFGHHRCSLLICSVSVFNCTPHTCPCFELHVSWLCLRNGNYRQLGVPNHSGVIYCGAAALLWDRNAVGSDALPSAAVSCGELNLSQELSVLQPWVNRT